MPPTPIYLDWQFWSAVIAVVALALSQFPPVYLWFRPRRLEVEVHSRIQITHTVGNPNVGMFVSLRNTGGRALHIRGLTLALSRDGKALVTLPAVNYYEMPNSQALALFVPFFLKPNESWAHGTNFANLFDRQTEKLYRDSQAALSADIRRKLQVRPEGDNQQVVADSTKVAPFLSLFERLFLWQPGEYVVELSVTTEPGSASFNQSYRFTLYESDTLELRDHAEDYKFGGGGALPDVNRRIGLGVPLARHGA